ncbi:MAG TPA: type II CAAX endopeptidase family protein [Stenotrophomonas sp.]
MVLPAMPAMGPARDRRPVLNFLLDALIGLGVLVATSIATGAAWGIGRGFTLMREAQRQGLTPDPHAIMGALGQPGVLAQMLMALASTWAAALVLYTWRRRATPLERAASLAAARRPTTLGWAALVAVLVFVFSNLVGFLAERAGIRPVPTNLALVDQGMQEWPVFLVLFAVVFAPAGEELLFRRVLFGRLLQAGRPWLGMLLSSVAFALLHEIPGLSGNGPLAILQLWLVYGSMGAAFAWLYWRTGSLWGAILGHGLHNGIALAALYWFGLQ